MKLLKYYGMDLQRVGSYDNGSAVVQMKIYGIYIHVDTVKEFVKLTEIGS